MTFHGIKHLARLHLCHLNHHKFGHNFQDPINSIYSCGHDIETTTLLFHWPHFIFQRQIVVKKNTLDSNIWIFYNKLSAIREKRFNACISKSVVSCTIAYTLSTQRFNSPLILWKEYLMTILLFILFYC